MSAIVQGYLFGGDNLVPHLVTVSSEAGHLQISGESVSASYDFNAVRISDRLARVPRYLYLPDGRTVETEDNDAVDAWLVTHQRGHLPAIIHWLEQRSRIAAIATLVLIASVSAFAFFGLPALARRAAFLVPATIEQQAGDAAMQSVRRILQPTRLSAARRKRVVRQLDRLMTGRQLNPTPSLEFWSMGEKNPNAFALPGGHIVVADELVDLAEDDDELAAVLAHEIGHQVNRHGLQSVFRGSAALLLVSSITGDLSTLTTFSSTIPFILLQRGYSREFETEADQYAIETLEAAEIDPHALTKMLAALEKIHTGGGQDYSYLSTHPATAERIRVVDARPKLKKNATRNADRRRKPVGHPEPDFTVVFNSDLGDEAPMTFTKDIASPLSQTDADYPADLAARNVSGSVRVEFVVDVQGNVVGPKIVKSTNPGFDASALKAVAQWKFSPAKSLGRPYASRLQTVIVFDLDEPSAKESTSQP